MSQKIPCNDFLVAGTKYRCTQDQVNQLKRGDVIKFEREPTNEHDANAIACFAFITPGPTHIGYVPAVVAKHLSPMMEAGLELEAIVLRTDVKCTIKAGMFWVKED